MSLNCFMHSRNIYRKKLDFPEMAKTYPSFATHLKTDLRGKLVFDYNDSNALRELTKTLLKKDFDLEVDIPEDRLIPTVPQRLNYILFVEDLMSKLSQFLGTQQKEVIGLDVGTGSVAIFPLIGCTINKNWNFVAIDIDPRNIVTASNNVLKNNLNHRIKIIECNEDNDWSSVVSSMDRNIHFSMTNPPFFSHNFNESDIQMSNELNESKEFKSKHEERRHYQRKKSSANTSDPIESVVSGGEVEFVTNIIEKSLVLKEKVMIYTSMLGKKQSLIQLKDILKNCFKKQVIKSFVWTEFCQGNTKRWGIAWTLIPGLNLREVPVTKTLKHNSPLIYCLPPLMNGIEYTLESVSQKIKSLLENDLKLDSFEINENKKRIEFRIRANTNVWTNQRRKRRENKRKAQNQSNVVTDINESNGNKINDSIDSQISEDLESMETEVINKKRELDDSECEDNSFEVISKKNKTHFEYSGKELLLLDTCLVVKRDKQTILIEMQTKELAKTKESTYQLFQYFKNKLI